MTRATLDALPVAAAVAFVFVALWAFGECHGRTRKPDAVDEATIDGGR
jgi:hypothetical protein